jgi:hypothetical protein
MTRLAHPEIRLAAGSGHTNPDAASNKMGEAQ